MTATKISKYELCDLGFEYGDYFQGLGVAFTEFDHVVVGVGDSPREALDDAIEQVATQGFDTSDLEKELANTPDSPTQYEEYGDEVEDESELADGPYYHYGIRWK